MILIKKVEVSTDVVFEKDLDMMIGDLDRKKRLFEFFS